MKVVRAALGTVVVAAGMAACGGSDLVPASQASVNLIEVPVPTMEVRAAIIEALEDRDFSVAGEAPGRITAQWMDDEETIRVEIVYDGQHYDIHYVQTTGLEMVQQPGGELYVDEKYAKIVKRLAHEIEENLDEDVSSGTGGPIAVAPGAPAAPAPAAPPDGGTSPTWQQFVPQVPTGALPAPPVVHVQSSHTEQQSSQSLHCCINGAYFECATQQAFESCLSNGGASCARVPAKDGGC